MYTLALALFASLAAADDVTGFVADEGIYTHAALGAFTRFGGYDEKGATLASDAQPFVALTTGVDLTSWLALHATLGSGFVANASVYEGTPDSPRDYALAFCDVGAAFEIPLVERVALALSLGAGPAAIAPSPQAGQPFLGGHATGSAGVRWLSLLPSTTIGVDVAWHTSAFPVVDADGNVVDALVIHGASLAPVITYVF